MKSRLSVPLIAGLIVAIAVTAARAEDFPHVVETPPLSPQEQLAKFHLPPGFRIELVAAEPDINKPLNLNFDLLGRLFVTQTIEYPFPAQGRPGRDAVRMIDDSDGDHRYDRVEAAVEGLNIPIGLAPVGRDLIVYSIPHIARWSRSPDSATWDRSELLFGPFGWDDTHGMNNGFKPWIDGWVYACHGFRNQSEVTGRDGRRVVMNSGNTYRFRPDGSRIEAYTFGQVNPFGLCFDPLGNAYTADCHSLPIYQLVREAYYPSFGKPHDGLGFGPTMIEHSHGSTGIGGIAYYSAEQFPPEYRDTIFVANPITHRINHDRLEPQGSTYRGVELPDFLRCDDPWFRPVDLQLGPDGALYVADFYNCIIGHYEVRLDHPLRDRERGRIWRIYHESGKTPPAIAVLDPAVAAAVTRPTAPPDLALSQVLEKCLPLLASANLTVRTLATNLLVDFFADALRAEPELVVRAIADAASPWERAHLLWVLERTSGIPDPVLEQLLADPDAIVRVHTLKALAERNDLAVHAHGLAWARRALSDDSAHVRRAAAELLGRHVAVANVAPLLDCAVATPAEDKQLGHVLRIALRNHWAAAGLFQQLPGELLRAPQFRPFVTAALLGVPAPHAAEHLLATLPAGAGTAVDPALLKQIARWLPEAKLPEFVAYLQPSLGDAAMTDRLLEVSRACQERGLPCPEPLVASLSAACRDHLASGDDAVRSRGLQLIRELRLVEFRPRLMELIADRSVNGAVRLSALETLAAVGAAESFATIRALSLAVDETRPVRSKAIQLLGAAGTDPAKATLVELIAIAPYQLAVEAAVQLGLTRPGAEQLLELIAAGKAPARVLQDNRIQLVLAVAKPARLEERLSALTKDLPPVDQAADVVIQQRAEAFRREAPRGDSPDLLTAGRAAFTKHCAACHRVEQLGNKVGPDLQGVGNRGLDRLLEDILDPNRHVDPAFHASLLQLTDGRLVTGLVLRQEGEVLVVMPTDGQEKRIPSAEVEKRAPSALSPMPANFAEIVPPHELNALLGFLLHQRATDAAAQ